VTSDRLADVQRGRRLLSQNDERFLCDVRPTGRRPASTRVVIERRAVSVTWKTGVVAEQRAVYVSIAMCRLHLHWNTAMSMITLVMS